MNINVNLQYPRNDLYEFETILERIDLDKECEKDIASGKGFIISEPQGIKKDIKSEDSIFSSKFGQTMMDVNPYIDNYKCSCGNLRSRYNEGVICPVCKTVVKEVSEDFEYFGWIRVEEPYHVIHPNLFKSIEFFIGSNTLDQILAIVDNKDVDGFSVVTELPKNNPFFGIGMIDFYNRFDEIMEYFYNRFPNKKEYYDDIMKEKDKIFCHHIPVYTTYLRPYRIDNGSLAYEGTNNLFNMIAKTAASINKNRLKMNRKTKPKNKLLYKIQKYFNELYEELKNILAQKKGIVRSLFGGRYNFTSRDVIVPGPDLRCDQVRLPYQCLVVLLEQRIINIIQKTYGVLHHEAYKIWYKSRINEDPLVYKIIQSIIDNYPQGGIPILINRNPTINYGSIVQVYCIGINDNYTMSMPLQILPFLNADFDGDTLNVYLPQNKAFVERCEEIYNPRNTFYISKNDGRLDTRILPARDTIVNANTLIRLARDNYSQEELSLIKSYIN